MAKVTTTDETRRQGKRLAALRLRLGLSKPLVAARLAFSATQTLDLYERGVSVIRLDQIERWADAYGITADEFVEAVITDRQTGERTPQTCSQSCRSKRWRQERKAQVPGS